MDQAAALQNPFGSALGARLYARGRPFHHSRAVARFRAVAGVDRLRKALDVGCGTGLSAKALTAIAEHVVALDSVPEMLASAPVGLGIDYVLASAEHMPFADETFDALTVSSSVHWFDQNAFFAEARRALVHGGWLAVYDHYFLGEISYDSAFATWSNERYLVVYPPPARGPKFDPDVPRPGLKHIGNVGYPDPILFNHHQLVAYLLTQSNCIAALHAGRITLSGLKRWLTRETQEFFPTLNAERLFQFRGTLAVLQAT